MEIKEVIRTLEDNLAVIAESFGPAVGTAISEAILACKKEVPRSLVKYGKSGYARTGYCSTCGELICNAYTVNSTDRPKKVCDKCGQAYDWQLSHCIHTACKDCEDRYLKEIDGSVCKHYADKTDEIMRIHKEEPPVLHTEEEKVVDKVEEKE